MKRVSELSNSFVTAASAASSAPGNPAAFVVVTTPSSATNAANSAKKKEIKSFFGYASEKNLVLNSSTGSGFHHEESVSSNARGQAGQLRNAEGKRFVSIIRSMDFKLK